MSNIDTSLRKMLSKSYRNTPKKNLTSGLPPRMSAFSKGKTVGLAKKTSELVGLAKGSVFFPFTEPNVFSPISGRQVSGRNMQLGTMGRVPKNIVQPIRSGFFNNPIKKIIGTPRPRGGKKDWDFDGVPNWKDCQPRNTMRQDFTPSTKRWRGTDPEMTAAEKFGGRNLKRLKKIGQGRDRNVYALDKDKVLKVAKNPVGLQQNIPERDLDSYLGKVKHYESGADYVVMQRADKPGKATTNMFRRLKKYGIEEAGDDMGKLSETFQKAKVDTGYLDYDLAIGDFRRKSNWGEVEGEPVLIDAGTLHKDSLNPKPIVQGYKVIKPIPKYLTDEWQDIKQERRQFSKKGAEDKTVVPYRYSPEEEQKAQEAYQYTFGKAEQPEPHTPQPIQDENNGWSTTPDKNYDYGDRTKTVPYKDYDIQLVETKRGTDAWIRNKGQPESNLDDTSGDDETTALSNAKAMIDTGALEEDREREEERTEKEILDQYDKDVGLDEPEDQYEDDDNE